jgi:hypothetical protein
MSARVICSIFALSQGLSVDLRIVVLMKLFLFPKREQSKNLFARRAPTGAAPRFPLLRQAMLSVVIETRNDEEGLARTLAALVGGAVEGVVREVIVCDGGSTDQTHRVAEHAGCHFIAEGGITAAIRQAKGEWLLLLESGARPSEGWTESVVEHVAGSALPARLSRARGSRVPFWTRIFAPRRALAEGLVITKRQATALSVHAHTGEAMARGLALRRLDAEIRVAPN